jgi:hypothetical protein
VLFNPLLEEQPDYGDRQEGREEPSQKPAALIVPIEGASPERSAALREEREDSQDCSSLDADSPSICGFTLWYLQDPLKEQQVSGRADRKELTQPLNEA